MTIIDLSTVWTLIKTPYSGARWIGICGLAELIDSLICKTPMATCDPAALDKLFKSMDRNRS
jgi:hypothetical protein